MDVKKGLGDFKRFIMRGNVIDLAIGVIIGGAFGKIVTSLVNDVIMPVLGLFTGKIDLSKLELSFGANLTLKYGSFLQNIIDFLIIALCVYLFVKLTERFHRKREKPAEKPAPTHTEELLAEIRDLLKERR